MNKSIHANNTSYVRRIMNSIQPQLIEADGTKSDILPADETKGFTKQELQVLLNCDEPATERLHDGRLMAYDATLKNCPEIVNEFATVLYKMGRPGSLDSISIRGRAVVCSKKYLR